MAYHGTLTINAIEAQRLKETEWFGRQDPYLMAHVGRRNFKTKVHEDGSSIAKWNQIFNVPLAGEQELLIEVFNKNMGKDDLIGKARHFLAKVVNFREEDCWLTIKRGGSDKFAGVVHLRLSFTPSPPFQNGTAQPTNPKPTYNPPPYQASPPQPPVNNYYPPLPQTVPGSGSGLPGNPCAFPPQKFQFAAAQSNPYSNVCSSRPEDTSTGTPNPYGASVPPPHSATGQVNPYGGTLHPHATPGAKPNPYGQPNQYGSTPQQPAAQPNPYSGSAYAFQAPGAPATVPPPYGNVTVPQSLPPAAEGYNPYGGAPSAPHPPQAVPNPYSSTYPSSTSAAPPAPQPTPYAPPMPTSYASTAPQAATQPNAYASSQPNPYAAAPPPYPALPAGQPWHGPSV